MSLAIICFNLTATFPGGADRSQRARDARSLIFLVRVSGCDIRLPCDQVTPLGSSFPEPRTNRRSSRTRNRTVWRRHHNLKEQDFLAVNDAAECGKTLKSFNNDKKIVKKYHNLCVDISHKRPVSRQSGYRTFKKLQQVAHFCSANRLKFDISVTSILPPNCARSSF